MNNGQEKAYSRLNPAQQEAVGITNGPVLVVAGAGTGKTSVIVERILRLIRDGIDPSSILALTFTEKAAGEMRDRVSDASLGAALDTTIATFNGFGNDLLETYGNEYGLGRLHLLGDTGQLVFLREHLDSFELEYFSPISNPDGQIDSLAGYVSLLKQQLVEPATYIAYAQKLPSQTDAESLEKLKHQELARFYDLYLQLCRSKQVIDYDDQLFLTIQLLRERPNILERLQDQLQYVLVDEFQDTNPMQSELVDLLVGTRQNIMVVGDDDQSIYGWRGATLANILDFSKRYPNAQQVTLQENYRSTQRILDSAYRLIQGNNPHRLEAINGLDKRLHSNTAEGQPPVVRHFVTHEAELSWLAEDISRRLAAGQPANTIAVLARRNHGVQRVHEALELHNVTHAVAGLSNNIYKQPTVRQLLEALKAIADPTDSMALFHCLTGPLFALDIHDLSRLSAEAKKMHANLYETIERSEDSGMLEALKSIQKWRSETHEQSVGTVAYNVITESGWKQKLYDEAAHDIATYTEVQALSQLFKTLKEFERAATIPSVQNYVDNLDTLQAAGASFADPTLEISDTLVNVLSVHRAKGLEWDTVYIVDCTEGSFPLKAFGGRQSLPRELQASQSEADSPMAEERRLMYVGATRAKTELILSYSDRHGNGAPRKPSRFLSELLGHEPSITAEEDDAQTSLELFSPHRDTSSVELPPGMLVKDHFTLSVSQIETWLRCPQDFYYRYVLAMPLPPAPHLEYGTLVHGVIESIHSGRLRGELPKLNELIEHVQNNLPQVGYRSKRSRERSHAQAIKTIQAVYERFMHNDLPLETELPFSVEVPGLPLTIRGRIDAVYNSVSGVEICDYKTGTSVTTSEQAKSRATGSAQLTLYALAWQLLRGELPAKLSLDFVETGFVGSVRKQPRSIETLQAKLATMLHDLAEGQYTTVSDHRNCMHPVDE